MTARALTTLSLLPLVLPLGAGCERLMDDDSSIPTVSITSPEDGTIVDLGDAVELVAKVTDRNDPLVGVSVVVASDLDGELCAVVPGTLGELRCTATLTEGTHVISMEAEDNFGNTAEDSVTLYVVPESAGGEGTDSYDDDGDGFSEDAGDCDDSDAAVSPAATEVTDGVDNDCDGVTDEADGQYSGTIQVVASGGTEGTCSGDLWATIDSSGSPAITGSGECLAGLFESIGLDGELTSSEDAEGTLTATFGGDEAVAIAWTGTVVADVFTGAFTAEFTHDGGTDTGGTDTGGTDTGSTDTGGTDTGGTDTGSTDTGSTDTGGTDTGSTDSGGTDTGASAFMADTGAADTGAADTGAADTGAADTGAADTGAGDTGGSTPPTTTITGTFTLSR